MGKIVLIVDDEKCFREMYKNGLAGDGVEVVTATTTIQANDLLKRYNVDCVVLDMKMPFVHGVSLYEVIRLFYRGTRVVVSSAYNIEEQRRVIMGAYGYYDKADGIQALLNLIRRALNIQSEKQKGDGVAKNGERKNLLQDWRSN